MKKPKRLQGKARKRGRSSWQRNKRPAADALQGIFILLCERDLVFCHFPSHVFPDGGIKEHALAAVGVCRGIRRLGLADAGIKYFNDILYHGKKLVGMLCEMSASMEKIDYIIMGIGINTGMKEKEFPEDFRGHATSFLNEGVNVSRRDLLAAVLAELEAEYKLAQTEGFGRALDDWRKLSVTLGEEVRVIFGNDNYTGKAVDIDDDGCLLVDTGREVRRVMAGDVSIRPADAPIPQR